MNTCIQCRHFSLREAGAMAARGFGWCPHVNGRLADGRLSLACTIGGGGAACGEFAAAPVAQVVQRRAWLVAQRGAA